MFGPKTGVPYIWVTILHLRLFVSIILRIASCDLCHTRPGNMEGSLAQNNDGWFMGARAVRQPEKKLRFQGKMADYNWDS